MIDYREQCRIRDLQRRFNFGTRDQTRSLKSFCIAKFYQIEKVQREKASDMDIKRGMENVPLASLSKGVIYFLN